MVVAARQLEVLSTPARARRARSNTCEPSSKGVTSVCRCPVHAAVGARTTPTLATRLVFTSTMKNAKIGQNKRRRGE